MLVPIAAEMRAAAAELSAQSVARMRAELPQLLPDEQMVTEHLVSTEAGLRQLAQVIEAGADPRRVELPPSTIAIARAVVQQQVSLADLMRNYRLAQELVWQWMHARIAAAEPDPADLAKAIELATGWIFGYVDGALVRVEQIYESEREAWLRARRRRGRRPSTTSSPSGNATRIAPRSGCATTSTAPTSGCWPGSTTFPTTVMRRRYWARSSPRSRPRPARQPRGAPGGVAGGGGLGEPARAVHRGRRDGRRAVAPGVRLAFGDADTGLAGFRRTHQQAAHAWRAAGMSGADGERVTRYREVAVAALASADTEHAAAFVTRVLGPLAADDEDTARVASTLAVYLQENCSRAHGGAAVRASQHRELPGESGRDDPGPQHRRRHPRVVGGPGAAAHAAAAGIRRTVTPSQPAITTLSPRAERCGCDSPSFRRMPQGRQQTPKQGEVMQTLPELDVNYMAGDDTPWIPFAPLSDQVHLKYWKIDPVRAEIVVSMKFDAGLTLPAHYHTGT